MKPTRRALSWVLVLSFLFSIECNFFCGLCLCNHEVTQTEETAKQCCCHSQKRKEKKIFSHHGIETEEFHAARCHCTDSMSSLLDLFTSHDDASTNSYANAVIYSFDYELHPANLDGEICHIEANPSPPPQSGRIHLIHFCLMRI